jgi:prevent-host-death family protein
MKSVSARVANQQFSRLLAEVKAGEEVVITSRGEPVAKLVQFRTVGPSPQQETSWRRLLRLIDDGGLPFPRTFTRDEMHER